MRANHLDNPELLLNFSKNSLWIRKSQERDLQSHLPGADILIDLSLWTKCFCLNRQRKKTSFTIPDRLYHWIKFLVSIWWCKSKRSLESAKSIKQKLQQKNTPNYPVLLTSSSPQHISISLSPYLNEKFRHSWCSHLFPLALEVEGPKLVFL